MESLSNPKKITQLKNTFVFHYTGNPNKLIITLNKESEAFAPQIKSVQIGYSSTAPFVRIDENLKGKFENRIREFSKAQLISAI